ncbi:MAG TPA: RagB/SusD family nutrient uptake outer membrane protein, partial [Chitinophagaceae bacterium]|nr:RagB/SusD family nutrient uptake outer membrane protein [Chitinophagaceae bacterium]
MKIYNKIILSIALLSMISSCSKNRLNENSSGVLTADQLFRTKEGFENALNGLYAEVRRYRSGNTLNDINNIMNVQAVIGVDNAYGNYRDPQLDVFNLWKNLNNAAFSQYSRVFGWLYETINAANTIVDRSANPAVDWTDAEKNRIVAEARLVRAWCYRHLTNLWGDVPLTLTESRSTNIRTDWERTPRAEVRNAMKEDLLFAEQHLPDVGTSDAKLIKGIAQHYLAELYLSLGDYTNAKTMALKVINNTNYKLITARFGVRSAQPGTPFTDMFIDGNARRSQGNTEALWVIQNELLTAGGEGNTIMRRYWVNRYYSFSLGGKNPFLVSVDYGGRGLGRLSPTRWAMNLYQAGDDRGSAFAWRYYYLINNPGGIPAGTNPRTGAAYKLGDTLFLNSASNETLSQANWPSTRKWDYAQAPPQELVDREYNDQ